jgi:hypothetical protein
LHATHHQSNFNLNSVQLNPPTFLPLSTLSTSRITVSHQRACLILRKRRSSGITGASCTWNADQEDYQVHVARSTTLVVFNFFRFFHG